MPAFVLNTPKCKPLEVLTASARTDNKPEDLDCARQINPGGKQIIEGSRETVASSILAVERSFTNIDPSILLTIASGTSKSGPTKGVQVANAIIIAFAVVALSARYASVGFFTVKVNFSLIIQHILTHSYRRAAFKQAKSISVAQRRKADSIEWFYLAAVGRRESQVAECG